MKRPIISILIAILASMVLVSAHGLEYEQTAAADGYTFEFGSEPEALVAGELSTFSLAIHNASNDEFVPAENVWIRLSKDGEIFLASENYNSVEGPLFIDYVFNKPGNYIVDVGYNGAKTKFALAVSGIVDPQSSGKFSNLAYLIMGIIGLICLAAGFFSAKLINRK